MSPISAISKLQLVTKYSGHSSNALRDADPSQYDLVGPFSRKGGPAVDPYAGQQAALAAAAGPTKP